MAKKQPDVCQIFYYDESKVNALKSSMLPEATMTKLTNMFKVLGDSTRVKILLALSEEELCVCDIAQVLGLSISAVSHQLRLLRNLGLVKYRNEGRMVFYTLDDGHIMRLVEEGIKHIDK